MPRKILAIAVATILTSACTTKPDCVPESGFELGMAGAPMPDACQSQEFIGSYRLGETLAEMRQERRSLRDHEDELDASQHARLRVLERDIPELETLARMNGFIEPAEPHQ